MNRRAKAPSSGSSMRNAGSVLALAFAFVAFLGIGAPAALAAPPTVTLDPITVNSIVTAHATGEVSVDSEANGGFETSWCFESTPEGQEAWSQGTCGGPVAPAASEPVAGDFTGLAAGKHYEARISYFNFNDFVTEYSAVQSFETDAAVAPTLALDAPGTVAYTTAQVSGTIDPEGGNEDAVAGLLPISWELQVSSDGGSNWNTAGSTSENPLAGSSAESNSPVAVQAEATGLTPNTAYKFRLLAHYAGLTAETAEVDWGEFTTLAVAKPTVSNLAVSALTTEGGHFAAEVDPNGADPAFDASWQFICAPKCQGLASGTVSGSPESVENDAIRLEPHTEYSLTLTATNLGGVDEETTTFTTLAAPPAVHTLAAAQLHPTSAVIAAELSPRKLPTKYWFEWGTADCSATPCASLPAGQDADAGQGSAFLHVSQPLSSLQPGTTYHYRLLAQNSAGTIVGDDRQFTTPAGEVGGGECANEALRSEQHSTALPDCRAYELVSPPDKNGGDVLPVTARTRAAADGSALSFASLTAFGDVQGTGADVDYISVRSGAAGTRGWATHALTPQQGAQSISGGSQSLLPFYSGEFSEDLSQGVLLSWGALDGDPNVNNVPNLYLRSDLRAPGAGSYELVSRSEAVQPKLFFSQSLRPYMAGASHDFRHVIFESVLNLTANASGNQPKLYEWADGTTRLAGVLPDGSAASSSRAGLGQLQQHYTDRTISADGSRVFFFAPSTRQLYARIDGAVTVQLSASEKATPDSPGTAAFGSASVDGKRVFFTTDEGLIDADTNGTADLYLWEQADHDQRQQLAIDATGGTYTLGLEGQTTAPIEFDATAGAVEAALAALPGVGGTGNVDVTGGLGGGGGASPYEVRFTGALTGVNLPQLTAEASALSGGAASATASIAAPVSDLTLISEDNQGPENADVRGVIGADVDGSFVYFVARRQLVAGEPEPSDGGGLYVWHDGAVHYIGWLMLVNDGVLNSSNTVWTGVATTQTARVSPDGRHLLFMSHSDEGFEGRGGFAGTDQGSTCKYDDSNGVPCRELYLYDADTGALSCASCQADGPAKGDAVLMHRTASGASSTTAHLSHALSDDGRYVFFATVDALVPGDTNGAFDVYEYDSLTGAQRLLSSGTRPSDSYLMDASASGHDAFFLTRDRLSAWDTDTNYDVYDARVGGGFSDPPPAPPICEGESCRSAGPGSAGAALPGSASLVGSGNPKPTRCAKNQRRVRGKGKARCVRKHHRHAKHDRRAGR